MKKFISIFTAVIFVITFTIIPVNASGSDLKVYDNQGTSMASPHVAAAAALIISSGKASTPAEVQTLLESTAVDRGVLGRDDLYGYGLINVAAALDISGSTDPVMNHPPVVEDISKTIKKNKTVTITLIGTDADGDSLIYSIVSGPAHGDVSMSDDGNIVTYTPNPGYTGYDSFTYQAYDKTDYSNTATVTLKIK